MEFDLADDDCTIYIEELKSDDPNLKINAVSKITNIADILGFLKINLQSLNNCILK